MLVLSTIEDRWSGGGSRWGPAGGAGGPGGGGRGRWGPRDRGGMGPPARFDRGWAPPPPRSVDYLCFFLFYMRAPPCATSPQY